MKRDDQIDTKVSDRIVRMRDLAERLGLSEGHLYSLIAKAQFPRPFPLVPGGRSKGWRQSTIDAYLNEREAEQRVGGAE